MMCQVVTLPRLGVGGWQCAAIMTRSKEKAVDNRKVRLLPIVE